MGGAVPPLSQYASWRGAWVGGACRQLYFTFTLVSYVNYRDILVLNDYVIVTDELQGIWREGVEVHFKIQ
jgi:hypothetical protein